MAKASSENNDLKKILTHLTALDKKVDKGFKEAAEFRQQTEENFAAVDKRMDDEFKIAELFRQKTKQDFVDTNQNIGEAGSMAYNKIAGHHQEFQKFQQETLTFQRRTEDFQQQTSVFQDEMRIFKKQSLAFQDAMRETIQHFTTVMERIERDLSILREAYDQLKIEQEKFKLENEELKKAKFEHETTIKKLEQRIAMLEVARKQPAL